MPLLRKHLVSLTAGLLLAWSATATAQPVEFEVGQPFPEIVLPAVDDDRPLSIADFRGQKVALHLFASW